MQVGDLSERKRILNKRRGGESYNKLAFLYILRFVLAFSIVLAHWRFSSITMFGNFYEITWLGANQCYILMSGMLFYLAYYKKLANEEISPLKFLSKRLFRIYFLYAATILSSVLFSVIDDLRGGVLESIIGAFSEHFSFSAIRFS